MLTLLLLFFFFVVAFNFVLHGPVFSRQNTLTLNESPYSTESIANKGFHTLKKEREKFRDKALLYIRFFKNVIMEKAITPH